MATAKNMAKKSSDPPKKPIAQVRKDFEKLQEKYDRITDGAYCYMCDTFKSKDKFYVSTDPRIKSGITPICKECCRAIGERRDSNNEYHQPTKESMIEALRYCNKPFLEVLWSASIQESENLASGRVKSSAYQAYMKNCAMGQYNGLTFKDSDMFKEKIVYEDEKSTQQIVEEHNGLDTYDSYIKNKEDVKRLLDYDPFEKEPVADQPFLYSQLLGMLDASEDANEDMMRVSSAIEIVRNFLQLQKINDSLAKIMGDFSRIQDNSATIKSLQDSKQKLSSMITNLAAESCLSLKNSKSRTKGEDTFSGRLRKLKDLNLRDSDLNGFDIATCKGMQQVADASAEAIIRGLHLTEDEMADIVATQRKKMSEMDMQTKAYKEAARILLKENLDLRDTLDENNISRGNLVNLEDIVGTYFVQNSEGDNE